VLGIRAALFQCAPKAGKGAASSAECTDTDPAPYQILFEAVGGSSGTPIGAVEEDPGQTLACCNTHVEVASVNDD
jgi:hypothetical protein